MGDRSTVWLKVIGDGISSLSCYKCKVRKRLNTKNKITFKSIFKKKNNLVPFPFLSLLTESCLTHTVITISRISLFWLEFEKKIFLWVYLELGHLQSSLSEWAALLLCAATANCWRWFTFPSQGDQFNQSVDWFSWNVTASLSTLCTFLGAFGTESAISGDICTFAAAYISCKLVDALVNKRSSRFIFGQTHRSNYVLCHSWRLNCPDASQTHMYLISS